MDFQAEQKQSGARTLVGRLAHDAWLAAWYTTYHGDEGINAGARVGLILKLYSMWGTSGGRREELKEGMDR
jgi:hypothetical protein